MNHTKLLKKFTVSLAMVLAVITIVTSVPVRLHAQAETGQISGTVTDPSGAAVPHAKVTSVNPNTKAERTAETNGSGLYVFTNLQPGEYQINVSQTGFAPFSRRVTVTVGSRNEINAQLAVGSGGTTVEVSAEPANEVNTETQTQSQVVTAEQITELPTLTRNPYALVATAGNVSDADPSGRGVGVSINGQRSASTDVLLDGGENVDTFSATVGQSTPLDSVQEFRVVTSNFTAEYGRASGGVVNVATKSGTNKFHGTAYEFNRVSALAANTFDNNANGVARGHFVRNQPGYSIGGPVLKNKLFFFNSTEWTRIRSNAEEIKLVPTSNLIAASASNSQAFFSSFGALRSDAKLGSTLNATDLGLTTLPGTTATTPLFQTVNFTVPSNAGGGDPRNDWNQVTRIDYNFSDKTTFYGRYAAEKTLYFPGTVSSSAYKGYDTGEKDFNQNLLISMTHVFSPNFVSQSKIAYNRLNNLQSLGDQPVGPTLYLKSTTHATLNGLRVQLPGYLPESPGSAIPFGGPQNLYQAYQDFSWSHGKHQFRFGGQYIHIRDNRTFGAFETAVEDLSTSSTQGALNNLIAGKLFDFQAAVYPQGKTSCPRDSVSGNLLTDPASVASCTVTLPVGPPRFSRNNRYHDGAAYAQDTWHITKRLTLDLGVRWEYYGVQHNADPKLDSNFYFGSGDRFDQVRKGSFQLAPSSPIGGLWEPDKKDFAPRIGFAYDVFGNGKTSFRGGYGIAYERNFGNVTFNVIQNPPNYAVLGLVAADVGGNLPVTNSNFGPLSGSTGSKTLGRITGRIVDPKLKTAYSEFWGASVEQQIAHNSLFAVEYSGSHGVHLYSIENVNRQGSGAVYEGDPGAFNRLIPQYGNLNFRGSDGFSYYNSVNFRLQMQNFLRTGFSVTANYTIAHSIDNLSSTFSESSNNFNLGLLDPFNPALDKGNADFDIRHRLVFSGIWDEPMFKKSSNKILKYALGGWSVAPIFSARTGAPFTMFDCQNTAIAVCPRWMPTGTDYQTSGSPSPIQTGPNSFTLITLPTAILNVGGYVDPITGTGEFPTCTGSHYQGCKWPTNMTQRNAFRAPGVWNLDLGIYKTIAIREGLNLQFRGELFNAFNHHNYYLVGDNTDVSSTNIIGVMKGGTGSVTDERRNVQLAVKIIF